MSDIFISYASEDRPKAEILARALEQQGWSVWWDRTIAAGKRFAQVIDEELSKARCVVVMWSGVSVEKDWVLEEAEDGKNREILVPVLIEDIKPPRGFRRIQAADLIGWDGDTSSTNFDKLIADISGILGPSPLRTEEEPRRQAEVEAKRARAEPESKQPEAPTTTLSPKKGPRLGVVAAVIVVIGVIAIFFVYQQQRETERLAQQLEDTRAKAEADRANREKAESEAQRRADAEKKRKAEEEKRQQELVAEAKRKAEAKQKAEEERLRVESEAKKPGTIFQDKLKDGSKGLKMVVVKAGSVTMGSPDNEEGRNPNEGPAQTVTLRDTFAIARNEVTVGEFRHFVQATNYRTEAEKWGGCYNWTGKEWNLDGSKTWRSPGFSQTDRHPVVCVSWNDAGRYLDWLSEQTGKRYRLPTEVEWEYAARAGTVTARSWGNNPHEACDYANVADRSAEQQFSDWERKIHNCRDGHVHTAPVGSFKPNRYGLFDMLGNVAEWVEDCYRDSYRGLPLDGAAWVPGDCTQRVLRGGSWGTGPRLVRSAVRFRNDHEFRSDYLGFRLAQDL